MLYIKWSNSCRKNDFLHFRTRHSIRAANWHCCGGWQVTFRLPMLNKWQTGVPHSLLTAFLFHRRWKHWVKSFHFLSFFLFFLGVPKTEMPNGKCQLRGNGCFSSHVYLVFLHSCCWPDRWKHREFLQPCTPQGQKRWAPEYTLVSTWTGRAAVLIVPAQQALRLTGRVGTVASILPFITLSISERRAALRPAELHLAEPKLPVFIAGHYSPWQLEKEEDSLKNIHRIGLWGHEQHSICSIFPAFIICFVSLSDS